MTTDEWSLVGYLGRPVGDLLALRPICEWVARRSFENDLPEKTIHYEFDGHGIEIACGESEWVRTIFLRRGDGERLLGFSFSIPRTEVLKRYGFPSKSGPAHHDSVLGDYGAWDKFTFDSCSIHVECRVSGDEFERVTLMRPDAVP